jgi:vacuolar-type H+-ATPase subunit I/STV1
MEEFYLGELKGIKVFTTLLSSDIKGEVSLGDLPKDIRERIWSLAKKKRKSLLDNWIQNDERFFIEKEQYYRLINLNDSILKNRSVDNRIYLNYLLQIKTEKEIIEVFKQYEIKGYSTYKKKMEKVEFLIDQLSDEEIFEFIEENEISIISLEFAKALQILNKKSRDNLKSYKIVNKEDHEIECVFSNFHNFETTSFITINSETIDDPERSCDCLGGRDMGFCCHFWIGFIISFKKGFFKLSEWRLTQLPSSFEKIVGGLKI